MQQLDGETMKEEGKGRNEVSPLNEEKIFLIREANLHQEEKWIEITPEELSIIQSDVLTAKWDIEEFNKKVINMKSRDEAIEKRKNLLKKLEV